MSHRATTTGSVNRLLFAVTMVAVLFAALMPAGWMPHRAGNDTLTLVLCTPDGPQEIQMSLTGDSNPQPDQPKQTCIWALAQASVLLADVPVLPPAPFGQVQALPVFPEQHLVPAAQAQRPASRAPPVLV